MFKTKKNLKLLKELLMSGEQWMLKCLRRENEWTNEDIEDAVEEIKQEQEAYSLTQNHSNVGVGTVVARACAGNNVEMLVQNINRVVSDYEELSAVSNFEFVDGVWRCIALVRELPSNKCNVYSYIDV